jgi:prophage regulatory protein
LIAILRRKSGAVPDTPERDSMAEILLRLQKVRAACALSRSELYRRMGLGEFPKPVAIGARAVAWRQSEIDEWIASRQPKSRGGGHG